MSRYLTLALLLASSSAQADAFGYRGGEVSLFAGGSFVSNDIELGNAFLADQVPGSGFTAGVRLSATHLLKLPKVGLFHTGLGVEGEFAFVLSSSAGNQQRDSESTPFLSTRAHLRLDLEYEEVNPFVTVGVGLDSLVGNSPFLDKETDSAFYWGVGFAYAFTEGMSARLDLRHHVYAGRDNAFANGFDALVGVAWHFSKPKHIPYSSTKDLDIHQNKHEIPVEELCEKDEQGQCKTNLAGEDKDTDGDGVFDSGDKCLNEKEDKDGFEDDDGCPDIDNDNDGIIDNVDKCPDVAEDKDTYEDFDGCPEADNDGDGVLDAADVCPNKAGLKGGAKPGCPSEMPEAAAEIKGIAKAITFRSGRSTLRAGGKRYLRGVAAVLKKHPKVMLKVSGYTDDRGRASKNQSLSLQRANAVKRYLSQQGVWADRITTVGHGSADPVASNDTSDGRRQNRRIELTPSIP